MFHSAVAPVFLAGLLAFDSMPASAGTITDTGQVVVVGGVLEIGQTELGARVVDYETDGPYDGVTVGRDRGASGALRLTNGAEFSTVGNLAVGRDGNGLVEVASGSVLTSGTTDIGIHTGDEPPCCDTTPSRAAVRVEGAGSAWVNNGMLTLSDGWRNSRNRLTEIVVADGARLETDGASLRAPAPWCCPDLIATRVTISGEGSKWVNSGSLVGGGALDFRVEKGAEATDRDVDLNSDQSYVRLAVDGQGSVWRTGDAEFHLSVAGPDNPGLYVTNGGRIESGSVKFDSTIGEKYYVNGPDSAWLIAGELRFGQNGAGGHSTIEVTGGGLLSTSSVYARMNGGGDVLVSGPNSRWENAGALVFGTSITGQGGLISISDGAKMSTGDAFVACKAYPPSDDGCSIQVQGAGSQFHGSGGLVLGGSTAPVSPAPGVLQLADSATADVVNAVLVRPMGKLEIADGTLTAPLVNLEGGSLEGHGHIVADLQNAGLVAPNASGIPLQVSGTFTQTREGTLSIELAGGGSTSLLEVLGVSVLAGQLDVRVASGFTPQIGDRFQILRYSNRLGGFDSYSGLDLGGGVTLVPEYGASALVLHAVPEPGTGLLLGLGLAAAATARPRSRGNSVVSPCEMSQP